jgi:hypothetical protein
LRTSFACCERSGLVELPDLTETAKLEQLAKPTAKQVLDDEIAF